MKRYLIFLLIISLCITNVSALTNTTVKPTVVMERFSQEFYGEVNYMDGHPVQSGTIIVTKDQYGNLLGNYTIKSDGYYGATKPRDENLIVSIWRDPTDRISRSTIIFVNFFIDDVRAKETVEFRQGDITEFDIKLPVNFPTPVPTTIPTTIPTPEPTTVPTTIITTVTTPASTFDQLTSPQDSDNTLLFYGLIAFGIIISGIIIITLVQIILAARSSRDDVIGPEDYDK